MGIFHKFLVLSSKFCNLHFFTRAVQGGISYLNLDLGVSGRRDAVFILRAVYMYKTNTSSVGCWFERELYDSDLQQVCSRLLLFSCLHGGHPAVAGHFTEHTGVSLEQTEIPH